MRAAFAAAVLGLAAAGAAAMEGHEPIVSIDEVCVLLACRPPTRVHLETDGQPIDVDFAKSPYVFHGVVSVLPGESLRLEADVRDGEIANLRYVSEVSDASRTIVVRLAQVSGGERPRMVLSFSNPFRRALAYRPAVMLQGGRVPEDTGPCSIRPDGESVQVWTEPVLQVFLIDLDFASGDSGCAR